ncbi:ECF transporter S component [Terrilactibacillus sp. BCM23-1]|uniref:Riboflavin transporter n=1 Tax=Terrilactibacillus tamarindi TaxID=2599694 RepID=A0A6N8CL04_9BACI|nr:ECF transporter S component [Terrilactibacillus tamarindi]MTT30514.1 ECF transporter S component [Terrilactibacillus tamarindi]
MKNTSLKKMIFMALLSTIGYLMMTIAFPLPLLPVFLTLDFSDIPALIGTILFGPVSGIVIEGIKNLIHYILNGTPTVVPVGEVANFVTGSILIVVFNLIFKKSRTTRSLTIGMLFGTILMTILMTIANYYIIFPSYALFLGLSIDSAVAMAHSANHTIHNLFTLVILGVAPFNIVKGMILTIIMIPLYIRLKSYFKTYAIK